MPAQDLPPFKESLINDAFGQDDLYVEALNKAAKNPPTCRLSAISLRNE